MPLPKFARQAKLIVRDPGTRIVNGNPVADWTKPSAPREYQGWASPAETDEFNRARTAVRTGWNIYLPWNAVVGSDSKITLPDGNDYAVIGSPATVPSVRGRIDHIFCYVERWAG